MNDFKTISVFLNPGKERSSRWISYAGLSTGIALLLCAIQMFINIRSLINEKDIRQNSYDFVSVSKTITNNNMGSDNRFHQEDIAYIKQQSFVSDAAPLISNQFRATISAGNVVPFSTDIFLEAINSSFIDTVPSSFHWEKGQKKVPIIFSADYLEMYNIFAPGQDLPQLSEQTLEAIPINLSCSGPGGSEEFVAQVVALSGRINSVLVPESFLQYANHFIGLQPNPPAARIFIKTHDAEAPAFIDFLSKSGLQINKDRMRFGYIKQMVSTTASAIGIFSILVILLSIISFGFYLRLMIARSKENLQLLQTLGYSKRRLSAAISKQWIPIYIFITLAGLGAVFLFQFFFSSFFPHRNNLSAFPSPYILLLAVVIALLCIIQNKQTVIRLLRAV